jgi:hypothetical protein
VHHPQVVTGDEAGPADADEHVGAGHHLVDGALALLGVGVLGHPLLGGVEVLAALVDRTLAVDADHVGHTGLEQDLGDGNTGGADAGNDHLQVHHLLAHDLQ